MIFKQRFFTMLLGLLFATVLTDQASALYDPGVGRFCSRDPIGYADGSCQYNFVSLSPPSGIDPFGLFDLMRYHPMPQLIQIGGQLSATINSTVQSIGRSIDAEVRGFLTHKPPGKGCVQFQERMILTQIKVLGVKIKIWLTKQASLCQDECGCMSINGSVGVEANFKIPYQASRSMERILVFFFPSAYPEVLGLHPSFVLAINTRP